MCQECGYESPKWMGKCPGCGEWNKMVEEVEVTGATEEVHSHIPKAEGYYQNQCRSIRLRWKMNQEFYTDLNELNRVLGGGVVKGSLVLIGGDPGIGKSTLLLQVSSQLANKGQSGFIHIW